MSELMRQARESSDKPRLNAFCRVAPSDRFSVRAMLDAFVFFRAAVFKVRKSVAVHARRLDFLAMKVSPVGERKGTLLPKPDNKENKNFAKGDAIIEKACPRRSSQWAFTGTERWAVSLAVPSLKSVRQRARRTRLISASSLPLEGPLFCCSVRRERREDRVSVCDIVLCWTVYLARMLRHAVLPR
jgi:hypothetical protein